MPDRLTVTKTCKLYINGKFVRSESGRSLPVQTAGAKGKDGRVLAHLARASRKDLREAVEAARTALGKWASMTAYNRGQVLYRMAEMMEGKRDELAAAIAATAPGGIATARREVDAAIDRLVTFSGWTDKIAQVLGCQNPVAGPYYNFAAPEPVGVVGVVCPDEPALLGLVSVLAPPLCAGNAVCLIASERHPLPAAVMAEVLATSDVPGGVVNILTGTRDELLEPLSAHRDVNAIGAANLSRDEVRTVQLGTADNLKRTDVLRRSREDWLDADLCESPWAIEPYLEIKTIWHPAGT